MFVNIPLILFAKAPVEGEVKTRLMPQLSAKQATQVAEVLLEETVKLASVAWPGKVVLAVWPEVSHPFILYLLKKYEIECMQQGEGDLGAKMYQAMELQGYPCAVMGCDIPHCKPEILNDSYHSLLDANNIIGLTNDGGYYLLGLQKACAALFQGVEWGSENVSKTTLTIAKQRRVSFEFLEKLNDIDEYNDLVIASSQIPALARLLDQ